MAICSDDDVRPTNDDDAGAKALDHETRRAATRVANRTIVVETIALRLQRLEKSVEGFAFKQRKFCDLQ